VAKASRLAFFNAGLKPCSTRLATAEALLNLPLPISE
jgi:hypothetical protein